MDKAALMQHDAAHISKENYPDVWQQNNLFLPLEYHFEPGQALDGVVVQIPLALLNQVENTGFDWHIPAFRHELITALIKSLPKTTRRNFVPAPNYADAVMASLEPMQGTFIDAISKQLLRMSGITIKNQEWDFGALPAYLKLQFAVKDEKNKLLASGFDLDELKEKLKGKVNDNLAKVAEKGIEQTDLVDWSFGELPSSYVQKQGQYEVKAYPALVDEGKATSIKLFDAKEKADEAHLKGLRRLVLLNIPSPIKYLQQKLPNKAKLGLYFNPFGKINELIDDCIAAAIDSILASSSNIRDEQSFNDVKETIRGELGDAVVAIALDVEAALSLVSSLNKKLKGKSDFTMIMAQGDIKEQLSKLIFKGFVTSHGAARIKDVIRYLKGIERRLEKLPIDPHQDKLKMLDVEKAEHILKEAIGKARSNKEKQKLEEIRWMIEELRISLFAQNLGTAYPISLKRIQNAIKECSSE